jgi:hypothetical protein
MDGLSEPKTSARKSTFQWLSDADLSAYFVFLAQNTALFWLQTHISVEKCEFWGFSINSWLSGICKTKALGVEL